METLKRRPGHCPRCGQQLAKDAPEGLCAACLFEAGVETITTSSSADLPTLSAALEDSASSGADGQRLADGQMWGPYRIGRLLGRGGMGEVYESEHVDSGRRIALKVLRDRLQNADQRARFLREGQLAASISHPHTVYIFGSEEISGMPVISMELLPGGTLKDRVVAQGPLPSNEAVSAILDIVGGLDAAHAAGILHRDIKPSNCFLDSEGAVKVGDFGLSISTLARDVHNAFTNSAFEGTPQFASPEQLRGEPLDVRADIYAVGATLYYLLTGRAPFEARDLRELVTRVTTEPAKSPRVIRPDIPAGLAAVVLKCLEKNPAQRPASYAALADVLRPFSLLDDMPARPGARLVAGLVDAVVVTTVTSIGLISTTNLLLEESAPGIWTGFIYSAYYFLLEGVFGSSAGKWLLGLRVTSVDGTAPGWWKIACRVTVFSLPQLATMVLVVTGVMTEENSQAGLRSFASFILLACLYVTARAHNGWAGFHDLQSGTRVVARIPAALRRGRKPVEGTSSPPEAVTAAAGERYGPFVAAFDPRETVDKRVVVAFDPVLRRKVWIQFVLPGTPPIRAARRDLGRPERLFWLTGKRSATENWDAFEAPDGESFLKRCDTGMDWPLLKLWLMDLVNELQSATEEGSLPALGLDRLWIRADQRLVLLDFPAPDSSLPSKAIKTALSPMELVAAVASSGSSGESIKRAETPSIPLSARVLLNRLMSGNPPPLDGTQRSMREVLRTPDQVQRWRRSVPIVLAAAPSLLVVLLSLFILPMLQGFLVQTGAMVGALEALRMTPRVGSRLAEPEYREAFEKYVVGTYGPTLASDEFWNSPVMQRLIDRRRIAEDVLARHPSVSPEELARVTAIVEPELERQRQIRNRDRSTTGIAGVGLIIAQSLTWITILGVLFLSLLSSLLVPGGVVTRFVGLAVVSRNGDEVSRWRSLTRALVAWGPAIVWLVLLAMSPRIQGWVPNPSSPLSIAIPTIGVLAVGAIWAIVTPVRGLQDRIAGTWIVPR